MEFTVISLTRQFPLICATSVPNKEEDASIPQSSLTKVSTGLQEMSAQLGARVDTLRAIFHQQHPAAMLDLCQMCGKPFPVQIGQ